MCLFHLVVFQFSSFLLKLEMKVAMRADIRYNVFAVLFGTLSSALEDKKTSGMMNSIRNLRHRW